jgi:AdoMet-dependent heme synthase
MVKGQHSFEQNPFIVIWEITRTCMLKCLHCQVETQVERDPQELTFAEGIALINEIAEMDNPILIFKAGDVLLRSDFFELAQHAVHKGLKVSISSSVTPNVTKEVMKKAKDIGISRWAFSLDGPDAATQDALSGLPGTFELTLNALAYLKEIGMTRQINTMVSKLNYDQIDEMAELVRTFDLALWNIIMYVPTEGNKEI